jgi:hypothetical protein
MCNKHIEYKVKTLNWSWIYNWGVWNGTMDSVDVFPSIWTNENTIFNLVDNAANLWNEAGSKHSLDYGGYGADDPSKLMIKYSDYCMDSRAAACTTMVYNYNDDCYLGNKARIDVYDNHPDNTNTLNDDPQDNWVSDRLAIKLENVISHEFGHLLGLDHEGFNYYSQYLLMGIIGYSDERHLTVDEKYGVRAIYGIDNENLKVSSSGGNTYLPNTGVVTATTSSDYQTYSKPMLAFQENLSKGYDYIMLWNKSSSRMVNYKFVNDCGSSNEKICSSSGAIRHYILGSQTLTAPSIAISNDGENSLVVWKQEEQQSQNYPRQAVYEDDIWYAKIPTETHSYNVQGYKIHDNSTHNPYEYCGFIAKTNSKPKVVWINKWEHFVVFYQKVSCGNNMRYIISDDEFGNFSSDSKNGYIDIGNTRTTNWNPIDINCKQKSIDNEEVCLLVYNDSPDKWNCNHNTTSENATKTRFRVLVPKQIEDYDKFDVITPIIPDSSNFDIIGLSHYSLATKSFYDDNQNITKNLNLLNRITSSGQERVSNIKFILEGEIGFNWYMHTLELSET